MVVLGTYNMSFAGDMFKGDMPQFPSEYSFHLRDKEKPRTFWNNALNHLKHFIEKKKPLAVGLQEMNLTNDVSKGGTAAVEDMLKDIKGYKLYSDEIVVDEKQKPAVSLIVNVEAGEIKEGDIKIVDNPTQKGRPILMALTDKNILLVSMHGMQNPKNGRDYQAFDKDMKDNNKEKLEMLVKEFVETKEVKKAYIMGDFNDRYDSIKEFNFDFGDAKYEGESPASCCHNWDSMGNDEHLEAISNQPEDKNYKQGIVPVNVKTAIPPEHGINVADYINKGDKVFAYPKSGELEIYKSDYNLDNERVSKASDHELVYMKIRDAETEPTAAEPTAPEAEFAAEPAAPEPTEASAEDEDEAAVGGKKYKRKTAKRVSKSKNNKSKKGGKKTKKNNSKKAKKNKSKKSKK